MLLITNLPSAESFCIQSSPSLSPFGIQTSSARISTATTKSTTTTTTTTFAAASTLDSPPSSEMSSFQKRMLQRMNPTTKKKTPIRNKNIPDNLMKLETLEEYKNIVGGNKDKLIVVRFYAPWCKACKAIAPAFYRLAATYTNALFIDVPVTAENANLHQGLGVTSLPFGHIYHPTGGLVEEIKISKKYFPKFARVLKTYVVGLCDVEEHEESELKISEKMSEAIKMSSKKP